MIQRALVTGGAGFVGHAVVGALMRRGVAVRVLDPAPAHPRWPAGVFHVKGDVTDAELVRREAADCDLIFHVAGVWDGGPRGEARMRHLNVGGTRAVLQAGRPVVYTSSSITCGYGPIDAPGGEDDPSEDPAHPIRGTGKVYRETKLEAESLVAAAKGWIVNPDYVVGPGDVGAVVTGPLLRAARLPIIPAPQGGKCFVGVDDVGEGHWLAFERGLPGRRYLLGAENRSYADIFATLARLMGRRPRLVPVPRLLPRLLARLGPLTPLAGALEQMSLDRYRDSRRAREELGWRPGPVDDALAALVSSLASGAAPR